MKLPQMFYGGTAALPADTGWIIQVEHGIFFRAKANPIMTTGQESAIPVAGGQGLSFAIFGGEHDVDGKILIHGPKSVGHPGPDCRPARKLGTRLHEGHSRTMIDGLGVHGFYKTKLIRDGCGMGKEFAQSCPTLPVLLEGVRRTRQWETGLMGGHASEALSPSNRVGKFLPMTGIENRFVVEQVHLGWRAGLIEEDHPLGSGRKMRILQHPPGSRGFDRIEEIAQSNRAKAMAHLLRKSRRLNPNLFSCPVHNGVFIVENAFVKIHQGVDNHRFGGEFDGIFLPGNWGLANL